ncbi:hypothetical protein, partial [Xanthomonas oryzae]|uniref:hypothetical protein n=1 Tax=Xanthomonas oryzae TaxID=347 RepID=UPI0015EF4D92
MSGTSAKAQPELHHVAVGWRRLAWHTDAVHPLPIGKRFVEAGVLLGAPAWALDDVPATGLQAAAIRDVS